VLHPHVCPIFDVGEQDGQPFIVMAYLDGPSLAERLAKGRFEDVALAVKIVEQLLTALAAVHIHGIVHRDLKPGNVLFDAAGRAVLTDFGLARPEEAEPLTSEGVAVGTPSYMAPEQAAGRRDRIGPWTDLYSLGVLLYQMVTGRLPFKGSMLEVLHRIVYEEPQPPTQFRPELDPALEAVILKALRKEPGDRYQTAADFGTALAPFAPGAVAIQEPAVAARPAELPSSVAERPALRWTWIRAIGWVVGGLIIVFTSFIESAIGCLVVVNLFAHSADPVEWVLQTSLPSLIVSALGVLLTLVVLDRVESLYLPQGLLFFARTGKIARLRYTIARGVSPNVRNDLGETPLLLAAANGHGEIVKLLLLHGANPALLDMFGQTAISVARAKGHKDIVDVLSSTTSRGNLSLPPTLRPWQPNARLWMVACITLGVSLAMGVAYLFKCRSPITAEQFVRLADAKQIRSVSKDKTGYLVGEVGDRFQSGRDPGWLPSKKFWLPGTGDDALKQEIHEHARSINPVDFNTKKWDTGESLPDDIWPGNWVIVATLAWTMIFLGIPLWFIVEWWRRAVRAIAAGSAGNKRK
jgi:hypothetical protein